MMGNVKSLTRTEGGIIVDQLTYDYGTVADNQLKSVADAVTANSNLRFQSPGTMAYTYDANGSMLSRVNATNISSNLSSINYNYLRLPSSLSANGLSVIYTYDAAGNKLKKTINAAIPVNNEYIGGIQYEGGVLKSVATAEGRVVKNSAEDYSYEYIITDHLGNGRLYFDINAGVARKIQETDYYAFGLDTPVTSNGADNPYKYNGKELQDGLNQYDYGARFYDPVIARWNVIDPLAEEFYPASPHNYGLNNPIIMVDPDGRAASPIYDPNGNLLGTDDQGLQGDAIVMKKDKFKQNMKHEDALKNDLGMQGLNGGLANASFAYSYAHLKDRPDYDGVMSYQELLQWGRDKGDSPVFLDASKVDLGIINVFSFPKGVGTGNRINTVGKGTPLDTYGPWGKNYMTLLSADGRVKLSNDRFDYEQHDLGKAWKEGAGTWTYEFIVRHPSIWFLQTIHSVDDKWGFDMRPYGYGKVKSGF